jgi:DNA-binding response OmpR family regulator
MKVLLVEDHPTLRRLTAAHLSERGFVVDEADTLAAAWAALDVSSYDALVVDLGLPDGDGAALIATRGRASERRGEPPPPALVLTARDGVADRIAGLNAGADDYLVKPFDLEELEARLRAILRRPGVRSDRMLQLGPLEFNTVTRQAFLHGQLLAVRRREALLLEALLSAPGRIVVRDVLEERLYGLNEAVTGNALEATASRLRRALAAGGDEIKLETHRGIGYRLNINGGA